MLGEGRPCPQILHQLAATESALRGVAAIVLRQYLEESARLMVSNGKKQTRRATLDELIDILRRFGP